MHGFPGSEHFTILTGRELVQLRIGLYNLQFVFDKDVSLSVEGVFVHSHSADENSPLIFSFKQSIATLTSIIGSTVISATSNTPEKLTIHFSNGENFSVFDSNPMSESVHLIAPGVSLIV